MKMLFFQAGAAGLAAAVAATASASAPASACDFSGDWIVANGEKGGPVGGQILSATANASLGEGGFQIPVHIRHGPSEVAGIVHPDNTIEAVFMDTYHTPHSNVTIVGNVSANCSAVRWNSSAYGQDWCRAWTTGCTSVEPPFVQKAHLCVVCCASCGD